MSVERCVRPSDGAVRWKVRWKEGGRARARRFDDEGDALAWDYEVRTANRGAYVDGSGRPCIPLYGGAVALVDEEDVESLAAYSWRLHSQGYAVRSLSKTRTLAMHREIMGVGRSDTPRVDFINGNRLDNRRSNLRLADHSLARHNSAVTWAQSGVRGVYRRGQRWVASTVYRGCRYEAGTFATVPEAAVAVNALREQLLAGHELVRRL